MYGTAHFVEHMLFMGNEKYPGESEFAEFMQKFWESYKNLNLKYIYFKNVVVERMGTLL